MEFKNVEWESMILIYFKMGNTDIGLKKDPGTAKMKD